MPLPVMSLLNYLCALFLDKITLGHIKAWNASTEVIWLAQQELQNGLTLDVVIAMDQVNLPSKKIC